MAIGNRFVNLNQTILAKLKVLIKNAFLVIILRPEPYALFKPCSKTERILLYNVHTYLHSF